MSSKNNNIVSHLDILKILAQPKNKYKNTIIASADKHLIKTICEGIYNLLRGNISISDSDKEKLKKYKNTLRKLVEKSSINTKKKILIQKGGFLQFLLPAVITGISSIISSVISSKNEARD